jgi:hypothetical protein
MEDDCNESRFKARGSKMNVCCVKERNGKKIVKDKDEQADNAETTSIVEELDMEEKKIDVCSKHCGDIA